MDDATVEGLMYIVRKYCERKIGEIDEVVARQQVVPFCELQMRAQYVRLIDALEGVRGDPAPDDDSGFLDDLDRVWQ